MSISRKEIRDAAQRARAGLVVSIDGERLTAVELGSTGKFVYTYMDHPGFTSVAKLVEFVQAKSKAEGDYVGPPSESHPNGSDETASAPATIKRRPLGYALCLRCGSRVDSIPLGTEALCAGCKAGSPTRLSIGGIDCGEVTGLTWDGRHVEPLEAFIGPTNHAPLDAALSNKNAERRIRSHRRKLRRSGAAKGISVLG